MLQIENQLKTNQLSHVHLLYGEERYMVRYYKKTLISKLSNPGDEMNCTFFRGQDVEVTAIAEAAQVLPFFAERRLLVVEDSSFFSKSSDMTDYIETFPETTYVIFVEREVDKRNRLYKWLNKNGCVTECVPQQEKMLKQWITGYLKKEGKAISVPHIELLLERIGTNMEMLANELDKLVSYVGEKTVVEGEDIQAVCHGLAVSKIFDMIDAVATKQQEKALSLYEDLLANKEAPMSILYLFSRHINILLQMKEGIANGCNRSELAKQCGIPPFTVDKYRKQTEVFKKKELLWLLKLRVEYEEMFKSGRLSDQLAVELFLIQALTNE